MTDFDNDSLMPAETAPDWAQVNPPLPLQTLRVLGQTKSRQMDNPPTSAAENSEDPVWTAYQQWKRQPNKQTTTKILRALQPTIQFGLHHFAGTESQNPILLGKAKILTLQAIERYDPKHGASLSTYVFNNLKGLIRTSRKHLEPIHIPERVTLNWGLLQTATADLRDELGREPTDKELADRTGLSLKRIQAVRRQRWPAAESQFQDESGAEIEIPIYKDRTRLTWSLLYDQLTPRDQKIMEWSLGWNGQPRLSGQQIASKLGLTPGAISQRKAWIQNRFNRLHSGLWGY